mmetsp:Transcript_57528/g.140485  ORF Transcript_57528/g.140485 Transcript_57528/m.140485 type:complete len:304 (+) Transcript_57528:161-1072(+)
MKLSRTFSTPAATATAIIFCSFLSSTVYVNAFTPVVGIAKGRNTSSSSSSLEMSSGTSQSKPVYVNAFTPVVGIAKRRNTSSSSSILDMSSGGGDSDINVAQYLVDLHDNQATFNFCGGMMFQLVLSDKLRDHLGKVASADQQKQQNVVVYDASKPFMRQIPDYEQSAFADNIRLFHGREIRQVPTAAGGMGFVLQLSYAGSDGDDHDHDPEGWSKFEIDGYDGWKHDQGRTWRNGPKYEEEGFTNFRDKFGPNAFGLNHRFYLHKDSQNRIWLSAEDGCEGFPAVPAGGVIDRIAALMNLGN